MLLIRSQERHLVLLLKVVNYGIKEYTMCYRLLNQKGEAPDIERKIIVEEHGSSLVSEN